MAKKPTKYTATDGKLFLELKPLGRRRYVVTSPFIPSLLTKVKSLEEAFVIARDTVATLQADVERLARTKPNSGTQKRRVTTKGAKRR